MLSIRPMQIADTHHIARYFCENSPDFYSRLGINPAKVPGYAPYQAALSALVGVPAEKAKAFYAIWLIDGEPVGHSSLKDIVYGKFGSQHLHMWKEVVRGKGSGGKLFCLSTLDFYERFRCQKIICEPSAKNPLPNRMLQKVGFPLLGSRVAASSDISDVVELNTYDIRKDVAETYLKNH